MQSWETLSGLTFQTGAVPAEDILAYVMPYQGSVLQGIRLRRVAPPGRTLQNYTVPPCTNGDIPALQQEMYLLERINTTESKSLQLAGYLWLYASLYNDESVHYQMTAHNLRNVTARLYHELKEL